MLNIWVTNRCGSFQILDWKHNIKTCGKLFLTENITEAKKNKLYMIFLKKYINGKESVFSQSSNQYRLFGSCQSQHPFYV